MSTTPALWERALDARRSQAAHESPKRPMGSSERRRYEALYEGDGRRRNLSESERKLADEIARAHGVEPKLLLSRLRYKRVLNGEERA